MFQFLHHKSPPLLADFKMQTAPSGSGFCRFQVSFLFFTLFFPLFVIAVVLNKIIFLIDYIILLRIFQPSLSFRQLTFEKKQKSDAERRHFWLFPV
ncbi:MAG: hypothetical protein IJH52_08300 [Oscillospiraceae bacterium]|nr:hypothetical protein [Oscillospiraceae bacterium]